MAESVIMTEIKFHSLCLLLPLEEIENSPVELPGHLLDFTKFILPENMVVFRSFRESKANS